MSFEMKEFLSYKGKTGDRPQSVLLENELKKMSGGMSLFELIKAGRLVKRNGEPFVPEGAEMEERDPERRTYTGYEEEVIDAIRTEGVFFYDDLEKADPSPRLLRENDHQGYDMSEPLDGGDMQSALDSLADEVKVPAKPAGTWRFLNRFWDFLSRTFGGSGTELMNDYRRRLADWQEKADRHDSIKNGAERIKQQGIKVSKEYAKSLHSDKSLQELINLGESKRKSYSEMKLAPSTAGNDIGELHRFASVGLGDIFDGMISARINNRERDKAERAMASMVAIDLILRERAANGAKPNEKGVVPAGPVEKKLNEVGYLEFIKAVRQSPVFKENVGKVTSRNLDEFLSSDGTSKIALAMIKASDPNAPVIPSKGSQKVVENLEKSGDAVERSGDVLGK